MPDYCTCGAQLPSDAVFCHKCGKPQREIVTPVLEHEPEFIPSTPPVRAQAPPLNFRNPVVLRIAAIVAVSATVLAFIVPFLNWVAGGFFAVLFYRRRTGSLLNLRAGMRMGWLTGVFAFVLWSIVFMTQNPAAILQERVRSMQGQDAAMMQQMIQFFQTPQGMVTGLLFLFLLITMLSTAGGALGAKLVGNSR